MTYNSRKYNRKSIRLKQYDYTKEGAYFITICCQNKLPLFGRIESGKLEMNEAGRMIEKWYQCLSTKFEDITCGPYVVMPNHFHAIVINNGAIRKGAKVNQSVGVNQSVYPPPSPKKRKQVIGHKQQIRNQNKKSRLEESPKESATSGFKGKRQYVEKSTPRKSATKLSTVVQWFKTMTTNEYIRGVKQHGWQKFKKRVWQRNYWEHIIRSNQAHQNITKYIYDNPKNWQTDRLK